MGRIVVVSDTDTGGAGIACARLVSELARQGECKWIIARGGRFKDAVLADLWPPLAMLVRYRLGTALARSESRKQTVRQHFHEVLVNRCVRAEAPEIINLHNLHEATSFSAVENMPTNVPVVWTLHDMWPLTGYCYYSCACGKYEEGCRGTCPEAGNWGDMVKRSGVEWNRRTRWYEANAGRLTFVAPSKWLADCARKRLPSPITTRHIPNGIDLGVFTPVSDRKTVRQVLGLPVDRPIILVGAHFFTRIKGGALFEKALSQLAKIKPGRAVVVVCGGGAVDARETCDIIPTGLVSDAKLLNLYYNAADLFVSSSLAENYPNVLLEACAAGTPSVAFGVGGCAEIIADGVNGFIAKPGDSYDLACCMARLLDLPQAGREAMRTACRVRAVREYGVELMARRYLEVFNSVSSHRRES